MSALVEAARAVMAAVQADPEARLRDHPAVADLVAAALQQYGRTPAHESPVDVWMAYLGVLRLLGDAAPYVPADDRESIELAMEHARAFGLRVRQTIHRFDIEPGEEELI